MNPLLFVLALAAAPAASRAPPTEALSPAFAAALPPLELVDAALDAHPKVREAQAELAAAQAERTRLGVGAQEYVASGVLQGRRDDVAGAQFLEGQLELSRTLRSGAKARLDREAGSLGEQAAADGVDDARHEAARTLAELWFAWVEAQATAELDQRTLASFEREVAALTRRVELKDAAQLDLDLAASARAAAVLRAAQSEGAARAANLALARRYPDITLPVRPPALPDPADLSPTAGAWREIVLSRSHEIRIAEQLAHRQRAVAARTRLDRKPDPTVGLRAFSERGGRENGIGVFVSRPLGGAYRSATADMEGARAAAAQAAAAQVRREVEETAERDIAAVNAGLVGWSAALASADAAQAAAARTRRAYELGERDVSDALLAERQVHDAQRAEIGARVGAWRALTLLRIDAHDLWAEHDPH